MSQHPQETPEHSIAVIGMAGRFPGAHGIDELWEILRDGKETIHHFSDDELRESGVLETTIKDPHYVKARGIIEGVELFDPTFFGLSPRQAQVLDPQQRIWLECVNEALEDAGIVGETTGETVGVFAGARESTYLLNNLCVDRASQERLLNQTDWDAYQTFLHNDRDSIATRTSYLFNFTGPSMNIQTACSTSLVAVAQACWSLANYQCDIAVAGGVCVTIPVIRGYRYQEQGMHSPDGHCRAFDAKAQGTVFSDGVGVVILKRLGEALKKGYRVDAVIRGWAINNDGRNKASFTAPSVEGQAEVIALAQAMGGVGPADVSYIEAHGTGTPIGDPIELAGLTQAFSKQPHSGQYCGLGSVKTNIGHLDAAAGIASFIKTVLALKHRMIPPSLHFETPTPQMDFPNSPFYVVDDLQEWSSHGRPRISGVSSLGVGGTNCHVVVAEASKPNPQTNQQKDTVLLTLSAKSKPALADLRSQFREYLRNNGQVSISDIAYTTNVGRSHHTWRLAISGESLDEVCEKLDEKTQLPHPLQRKHQDSEHPPPLGFLFTGQGAQYPGMAKQLFDSEPVFRQTLQHCVELLQPHLDHNLLSILFSDRDSLSPIHGTAYTQPVLFSIEYALAELWRSWGIRPSWVMGHSLGEYVAACVAGVFSLEEGLRLVTERGRLMSTLTDEGRMVSVFADPARIANVIESVQPNVSIAAFNGPQHIVISGKRKPMDIIVQHFQKDHIHCRDLHVSHAFHSPLIEPILEPLKQYVESLDTKPPAMGFISNVSGRLAGNEVTTGAYWRDHSRNPVRFTQGITTMAQLGCQIFLEIGPHPMLASFGRDTLPNAEILWLSSLRRNESNWRSLSEAVGQLYMKGVNVDWLAFHRERPGQRVRIPTYPFQRQRFWVDNSQREKTEKMFTPRSFDSGMNPMVGERLRLPGSKENRFETFYSRDSPPYLQDHRLYQTLIVPGASHVAMILQAANRTLGQRPCRFEELVFMRPMFVPEEGARCVQLIFSPKPDEEGANLKLLSAPNGSASRIPEQWTVHMTGCVRHSTTDDRLGSMAEVDIDTICQQAQERISGKDFYASIWGNSEGTGEAFKWIDAIWKGNGEALARTKPPPQAEDGYDYVLHPGLFEASFQVLHCCQTFETPETVANEGVIYVPFSIESFSYFGISPDLRERWCYAKLREFNSDNVIADLYLADQSGRIITEMIGLHLRKLSRAEITRKRENGSTFPECKHDLTTESVWPRATSINGFERYHERSAEEQGSFLLAYVQNQAANLSGFPVSKFDPDSSLIALGFDSLMAIMLANRIKNELGLTLSLRRLLSNRTLKMLCEELHQELLGKPRQIQKG